MKRLLFAAAVLPAMLMSFNAHAFGADRHVKLGLTCESCHGPDKQIAYPSITECRQCHDPKTLAEKTKDVKPHNPHSSPHYGNELDCALCHLQHSEPENYCNQCHTFDFKVK